MVNPHFQCGMPHAAQICETNPIYRTGTACRAPISRNEPNLHRGRPVEDQKTRNKPNLTPAAPRLCETNPIYRTPAACRAPKMRNEPNLPPPATILPRWPKVSPDSSGNPIATPAWHPERRAAERSAAAQSRGTCSITIAKGDSLPVPRDHTDQICETNPIYPHSHPANHPKMRNEPNCHPRVASRAAGCGAKRSGPKPRDLFNQYRQRRFQTNKPHPHPKNAKRTQSQYRRPICYLLLLTKRTQFHPHRHPAPRKKCETNPISNHQYPIYNIQYTTYNPLAQFPTINIHSIIYNIQPPGPISSHLVPHTWCLNPGFFGFSFENGIPF